MRLIIDGDPIVYRTGFAGETRWYEGVVEYADGTEAPFRKAGGEYAPWSKERSQAGASVIVLEQIVDPQPWPNVRQIVDTQIGSIINEVEQEHKTECAVSIILTGAGNFRDKLAKRVPYKGNRDRDKRPFHYQAIRDYLVSSYGAFVVNGREADDEVCILARRERSEGRPVVVATIDKDLEQAPGLHYDYLKKVFYEVSEYEARRMFWIQALSGDPGDNVPGCHRVGRATAERLVDVWFDSCADSGNDWPDEKCIWQNILGRYCSSTDSKTCPYGPDEAAAVALETAQLVYMQQHPNELWTPDGVIAMKSGVDFE